MLSTRIAAFLRHNAWALNLVFLALGSYFVAGATMTLAAPAIRVIPSLDDVPIIQAPVPRLPAARGAFSALAERNLLALKREQLTQSQAVSASVSTDVSGRDFKDSELRPCTISASLRATLVAEVPEWSAAVLLNNVTHETGVFSINDGDNEIAEDVVLVAVRSREIVVRRRDHFERCLGEGEGGTGAPAIVATPMYGDEPPALDPTDMRGVTKLSENDYRIERAEVDRALANLNEVATQARVVPSYKNGKPNGFKMFSIKKGSIYDKIGLQNGDVIQRINGYDMNSPDRALEIFAKLRDATSLAIEVQRRGDPRTFNYAITGR